MARRALFTALATLVGAGGVFGYLIYSHDVDALQGELSRLKRIDNQLRVYDKSVAQYNATMFGIEKHARVAAYRRHDDGVSAHPDAVYETGQADIEKTDVAKLSSFVSKFRAEQAARAALLLPLASNCRED